MVAEIIAEILTQQHHTVTVKNFKDLQPDDLFAFDAIVWGSNTWLQNGKDGQPHQYVLDFIEKMNGREVTDKRFAVYGLGDSSYARVCGSVDHLERLVSSIKGNLFTPSLRVDSFYFDQENNTKLVKSWAEEISQKLH